MKINITLKFVFIIFLIFILKPPLNNPTDLFFVCLGIFIISCFKIRKGSKISNNTFVILFIFIVLCAFLTNKRDISEYHSTFFSESDIRFFKDFLPDNIIKEIEKDYLNFDIKRALNSHDGSEYQSEENFNNNKFINQKYSFSTDNFLLNKNNTRNVSYINFDSRETLRINDINTLKYNLAFDKDFRRQIPFYIIYKIPENYEGSKVCGQGNIFYSFVVNTNIKIKNISFQKKDFNNCIEFNESKDLYILGYSINDNDNLTLQLNKNNYNYFKDILHVISIISYIIIFLLKYFSIKKFSKYEVLAFCICVLSTLLFILLKDSNTIFGLRYFRGGADGLVHEYHATMIIKSVAKLDFFNAFKGGEDSFYFMPGLRYYLAITKLIFGDTNYGHILIGFILPISLFYLFKNIISEKIAFFLIILFTFLPLFENMGFGHFNYIHQIIRNHAETLSITIIIFCIMMISKPNFNKYINFYSILFYCFILSFATFCRPNFFPITTLIFFYLLIISYQKNLLIASGALIGYSFILISLIHNLYYAGDISLFTKTNVHFAFNEAFKTLNLENGASNLFIYQFLKWNPIYNLHRLIILIFVIYCFFNFKKNPFIYLMIFSIISQHLVLFLTHPDSRYAYLAWLLTFIMFVYYLFNNYLRKFK